MTFSPIDAPVLETDRLILRAPLAEDWPALRDFVMSERAIYAGLCTTEDEAWGRLAHYFGHWHLRGYGHFIIVEKASGNSIGRCANYFPPAYPEREIGYALWAGYEGRGFASEAANRIIDHAYHDLGWDTAVSYVDVENHASIKVLERLGAIHDPDATTIEDALVYRHPKR